MDRQLLAWGLRERGRLPRLWLFTDDRRLPDPLPAVRRLPVGRAGVVLRHDSDPDRMRLARKLAFVCRARRLVLVIAGDSRLAAACRAGVHLRGGWRLAGPAARHRLVTSSAHSLGDLHRAARAGVDLVFLSPAFPTESHRGAPGLGAIRWANWARQAPACLHVAALGGVDGHSVRRLPRHLCDAVGAIGALA